MTFPEIEAVTALIKQTVNEKAGRFVGLMGLTDADYQAAAIAVIKTIDAIREQEEPK